ncbi:PEP/pyruvate-binding domain-containing protein [Constantimarinum furrinae]|uniref:PEP/pyruvate-binding domain-containing protein n=1 Tax=Constantimarinum furrinae TaxID=2562285 RepID=UPI00293BF840|nr:PEP/pyruvate-binding domain-containing protein [Constantimarinum furrinae]
MQISLLTGQELPVEQIKKQIEAYKDDPRGPYDRIRWFCKDGTLREPKDPCPENIGGGVQHASYKPAVKQLAEKHHIFFGLILANTERLDFWDEANNHSMLKQYQLGNYLQSIDDGWIQRKSQFYRGAVQSEDEQEWGVEFYEKYLPNNDRITKNYYLLRQSLRDVPHDGDSNLAQLMRSQSKVISDEFPKFMDIRIKIHGNPSIEDIQLVENFINKNEGKIPEKVNTDLQTLTKTMKEFYAPLNKDILLAQAKRIRSSSPIRKQILEFLEGYDDAAVPEMTVPALADILCTIRSSITIDTSGRDRLLLLDLSNSIEDVLLKKTQDWQPDSLLGLMEKIRHLSLAAAGTGLIELWEWEKIKPQLETHLGNTSLSIEDLNQFLQTSRGVVEWSAAMVKANYQDVVDRYTQFEPLAYGFIDDRVRSSVALYLGESVAELGKKISEISGTSNEVMNIKDQSNIRGLNPGYAKGELVVISGTSENIEVSSDKIYIFEKPPSDLKPVAGIMTVSEGNLVSHVQLLARNLGIPNAALSDDNLKALKKYNGDEVFMAVSPKGNVILKKADDMSPKERELFGTTQRSSNKIAVPVAQIRLDVNKVLNMREVNSKDSGMLCGPKAANLGELKAMFPENVVEGIIIPFGVFRNHMEQQMPGQGVSYWEFLNSVFVEAEAMRNEEVPENVIEDYQLSCLNSLKQAIENIELDTAFVNDLQTKFKNAFGSNMGTVPVFLRSDTNMEDLKEFTGAGLNLTLFNIVSSELIIEGIKKVWASPYTERSFKWRQKYLLNPENVFPSILIIPSVDVEYSGVMITKGINSGKESDLTVAFSRGAGGAVDGQIAETRLLTPDADVLLAPARESGYMRLPKSGGTSRYITTFDTPILNDRNIKTLRQIADKARKTLAEKTNDDYKGAWDIELGFENDKVWLFQIRPFVENKQAKSSDYLSSITPSIDTTKQISLQTKL